MSKVTLNNWWVARDGHPYSSHLILVADRKPMENFKGHFTAHEGRYFTIDAERMPNITFENSPKRVTITIELQDND